ncbi:MAG: copper chaperone PCu(A)C [Alphaproteobacteria bacterium]|nr:copper chaperone PCu(A)C [Alphaproteobacteria bacterium]
MKKILLILTLGTVVAFACTEKAGTLELSHKTFRALKGAVNGSAYLTIKQTADTGDKLISASCSAAERMEIHDHIADPLTKAKKMVEIKSIDIPGKKDGCWLFTCWFATSKPVKFVKGGKHLMLMGLKPGAADLKEVEIKLVFEKAGEVTAKFKAEGTGGKAGAECEHHKH